MTLFNNKIKPFKPTAFKKKDRIQYEPEPTIGGGYGGVSIPELITTPFSPTQINLSWASLGSGYTYDIYRDGVYVMSTHGTFYYDGGLARTSSHTYTVHAAPAGGLVTTLGPKTSISLEPDPQNLALYSQDFKQGWAIAQGTIDTLLYAGHDSVMTANGFVESGSGLHQAYQAINVTQGTTYTLSARIKAGTRTWVSLNIQDSIAHRNNFNLTTGAVGAFPDSPGGTPTMTDDGNGYWRCSMAIVPNTNSVYIAINSATGDNTSTDDISNINYVVGGSSLALYLEDVQFQQNYPATSYVATLGSPVALSGLDRSPPSVPGSTYSIPTSYSSTSITWNPSSDDTELASYEVFRNNFQVATVAIPTPVPSAYTGGVNRKVSCGNWYYDTGLSPSTSCTYLIRSVDTSGNRSAFGTPHTCSTVSLAAPDPTLSYTRPAMLPEPNPSALTLRAKAATNFGLYFGSLVDPTGDHFGVTWYDNALKGEFNLMEPGNQLKFGWVQPSEGVFDFSAADTLMTFAQANNLKVRGHTLLWGSNVPAWLQNLGSFPWTTKTKNQLQTTLVNHISTVMGHCATNYPGLVIAWDVTNEVMGWTGQIDTATTGDPMMWTWLDYASADGLDYIRIAFAAARAADPTAKLFMNDYVNLGNANYSGDLSPNRTRNMLNAVRGLLLSGAQIDGVGFQAHGESSTYEEAVAVMKEYRDMGLQCNMTEIDYSIPRVVALPAIDTAGYNTAADVEAGVLLKAALDSPNCTIFNIWGFDGTAPALYGQGGPSNLYCYPWDTAGNKSPIYDRFYAYLNRDIRTPGLA